MSGVDSTRAPGPLVVGQSPSPGNCAEIFFLRPWQLGDSCCEKATFVFLSVLIGVVSIGCIHGSWWLDRTCVGPEASEQHPKVSRAAEKVWPREQS